MTDTAVTVLMSARDAADTLGLAIRSLQAQTLRNWELLLVDDGSRDATGELASAAAATDDRIRLIRGSRSEGLPVRLNQLLAMTRTRYVARMDADDMAFPARLERQLAHLERRPDIDLVGASMIVVDAGGDAVGIRRGPPSHEEICARPQSGFPLFHPTWFARAEWLRRFPYSPAARRCEDQELLLRSFATSRFANEPEPLLAYREDRLVWRDLASGRRAYARAAIARCLHEHQRGQAAGVVAEQALKATVDLLAIATGTERKLLRHRARPLSDRDRATWHSVRSALGQPATTVPQTWG